MLDPSVIDTIITINKDDSEMLGIIMECLKSFEEYHSAVYRLEIFSRVYASCGETDRDTRERINEMDKMRTVHHNALLANVNILNRIALSCDEAPVYDGIVSEERPYRREVANAVFEYVEYIINNRK